MISIFEAIKAKALEDCKCYPLKSSLGKAFTYFLKNYQELTLFTKNWELPIDNNSQERLLRRPVVGRKTWYGTHSRRGAEPAAILFSLVESCKLNGINPREYFKNLVEDLHDGKPPYSPRSLKTNWLRLRGAWTIYAWYRSQVRFLSDSIPVQYLDIWVSRFWCTDRLGASAAPSTRGPVITCSLCRTGEENQVGSPPHMPAGYRGGR